MKKIIDLKGNPAGKIYEVDPKFAALMLAKNHFARGGRYIDYDERHRYLTEVIETKIVPEDLKPVVKEPIRETIKEVDEFEAQLAMAKPKKVYEATTGAKEYAEENNIDLSLVTPKNGNKITINDLK